jgi:hypothetical protein
MCTNTLTQSLGRRSMSVVFSDDWDWSIALTTTQARSTPHRSRFRMISFRVYFVHWFATLDASHNNSVQHADCPFLNTPAFPTNRREGQTIVSATDMSAQGYKKIKLETILTSPYLTYIS